MISSRQLLTLLVGAAVGAGGWMFGLKGARENALTGRSENVNQELSNTREELQLVRDENASLRSLAQGGGEVSVPQELIHAVEKDYGLRFYSNPVIHRIAAEELGYRVQAALESRLGPHGVEDREEAYRRIGWIAEEDDLLAQLVAARSVGAKGWFDEQLGEAWVTDQFDLKNVPDQATLLRLLVRVLLNQHFPPGVVYSGDDAERAREALHAGAAAGAEARFYSERARSIGFLKPEQSGLAEQLILALPVFLRGVISFPEDVGKPFTDTLFVKSQEEFGELLRDPPQTTFAVAYPKSERESSAMDLPSVEDEVFLNESGGYLGIRMWLEESEEVGTAEEIASEWVRDGYLLFGDGDKSMGVLWEIEFQKSTAAQAFLKVAEKRIDLMKQTKEERFLAAIKLSPKRIRFLNVASESTLSQLLHR